MRDSVMMSWPVRAVDEGSVRVSMPPPYGSLNAAVERPLRVFLVGVVVGMGAMTIRVNAQTPQAGSGGPIKLAVLGDSLTAGYGLPASAAFPVRLQQALKDKGIDADILNAGVSGDTT